MVKEGYLDYKKLRKRWFFKESLTEWFFFLEPKNGSSMASLEEPFEAPLFLRVHCMTASDSFVSVLISPRRNI